MIASAEEFVLLLIEESPGSSDGDSVLGDNIAGFVIVAANKRGGEDAVITKDGLG